MRSPMAHACRPRVHNRPQQDNVIVALPYSYQQSAFDASIISARASIYLLFAFLAVNAVCFFGGFNTFNIAHGLFRA
jgi:hypothetical protein